MRLSICIAVFLFCVAELSAQETRGIGLQQRHFGLHHKGERPGAWGRKHKRHFGLHHNGEKRPGSWGKREEETLSWLSKRMAVGAYCFDVVLEETKYGIWETGEKKCAIIGTADKALLKKDACSLDPAKLDLKKLKACLDDVMNYYELCNDKTDRQGAMKLFVDLIKEAKQGAEDINCYKKK